LWGEKKDRLLVILAGGGKRSRHIDSWNESLKFSKGKGRVKGLTGSEYQRIAKGGGEELKLLDLQGGRRGEEKDSLATTNKGLLEKNLRGGGGEQTLRLR